MLSPQTTNFQSSNLQYCNSNSVATVLILKMHHPLRQCYQLLFSTYFAKFRKPKCLLDTRKLATLLHFLNFFPENAEFANNMLTSLLSYERKRERGSKRERTAKCVIISGKGVKILGRIFSNSFSFFFLTNTTVASKKEENYTKKDIDQVEEFNAFIFVANISMLAYTKFQ